MSKFGRCVPVEVFGNDLDISGDVSSQQVVLAAVRRREKLLPDVGTAVADNEPKPSCNVIKLFLRR